MLRSDLLLIMIALAIRPAASFTRAATAGRKSPFLSRSNRSLAGTSTAAQHVAALPALSGNLVSVEDCLAAYGNENTVFVDSSWHLVKEREGRAEYEEGPRIKGARFFDIDDVSSKGRELNPKGLPHMMPPKNLFAAVMDALDIKSEDSLVIYGTEGNMFTARAWYAIRAMGHPADKVHLMQGSLKEWEEKGGAIETGPKQAVAADDLDLTADTKYHATDAANVVSMSQVLKVVSDEKGGAADSIIVDARGAARFRAEAPEPREGLRGGHMPGSFNVPFTQLLNPEDPLKFKDAASLGAVFQDAGVDVNTEKKIICSCGSGVTACVIATALEECGRDPAGTFIYDGSWLEWGGEDDTPIVP